MAIDPKLVSIIPASQLPTGDPTSAADFLFYEGDALKKGSMSNIYDKLNAGIKGVATQSNAPTVYSAETYPDGLFERYVVSAPITSPNSWGNIAVTQAELDANTVFFNVTNGVVVKELSAKAVADPAKLPLYSAIKSANIVAGTQFIDDENGNVQYRVKTGQTLLTTDIPANVIGAKVEYITSGETRSVLDFTTPPKTTILPFDKSAVTFPTTRANQTRLWGLKSMKFNKDSKLTDFTVFAAVAGNIVVSIQKLSGANNTIIHSVDLAITSIGTKVFTAADLLVNDAFYAANSGDFYVTFSNKTTTDSVIVTRTYTIDGYQTIYSNSTITEFTNIDFNTSMRVEQDYVLFSKIKKLEQNASEGSGIVTNWADFLTQINANQYAKFDKGTIAATSTYVVKSGDVIEGMGKTLTTIEAAVGVDKIFDLVDVSNVEIKNLSIKGRGTTIDVTSTAVINSSANIIAKTGIGTGIGISVVRTNNVTLTDIIAKNFTRAGFYLREIGVNAGVYTEGASLTNLSAEQNYQGIEFDTRGEYSNVVNYKGRYNIFGAVLRSGNVEFSGGYCTSNRVGFSLEGGASNNDSHGTVTGMLMNHNKFRALFVNKIQNNHTFSNCQIFDGFVEVIDATGFSWIGGLIAPTGINLTQTVTPTNLHTKIIAAIFSKSYGFTAPALSGSPIIDLKMNTFQDNSSATAINN